MKKKLPGKTPIKAMTAAALEKDFARCEKSLRNKGLKPISLEFYTRRQKMIGAELARRS